MFLNKTKEICFLEFWVLTCHHKQHPLGFSAGCFDALLRVVLCVDWGEGPGAFFRVFRVVCFCDVLAKPSQPGGLYMAGVYMDIYIYIGANRLCAGKHSFLKQDQRDLFLVFWVLTSLSLFAHPT